MERLKQKFRERLPARVAAIRAALADLADVPEEATAALRRVAHALHGSGGTYGFPGISEAARAAEDASDKDLAAEIERLLAVLEAELPAAESGVRILLVDDDPENNALLSAVVAPLGAHITAVESAAEARLRLRDEQFAVVLLDLMLPDADGRSVLLWLREQEQLADTPVFVLSGLNSARVKAECYSIGADGFFEKPIDPDVVRAALSSRLGKNAKTASAMESGADDRAAAESARATPPVEEASPAVTCNTVLLVEDDDLVAAIIKHRLTRAGFTVVHFADGVDARDNAKPEGVCIAILDIKIPGIDGFELLEALRTDRAFARIPVIILTALNNERDVVRGLELGASDYMVKPFSPTELLARVNRLLQTA
jgi:DNA-binding response OmpR family regulator